MGNALRLGSPRGRRRGGPAPWCDEDERYDTPPVFERGQYIGWQTPNVAAALDKDREGLGPTGRYLSKRRGPEDRRRFGARSQEDEWHLPHLDDLREHAASRRDYWLEEGLERFAEHGDRITELTDAGPRRARARAVGRRRACAQPAPRMDVLARRRSEDRAKMEEEQPFIGPGPARGAGPERPRHLLGRGAHALGYGGAAEAEDDRGGGAGLTIYVYLVIPSRP